MAAGKVAREETAKSSKISNPDFKFRPVLPCPLDALGKGIDMLGDVLSLQDREEILGGCKLPFLD